MGLEWKRNVSVEGAYLDVTRPGDGNHGNPPGRKDPADEITIYEDDRKNGGAKVRYTLTGTSGTLSIENKEKEPNGTPKELPAGFSVSTAGNTLTIHDGEDAANGIDFHYYVKLGPISSKDPMIHNQSDGGVR